MESTFVTTDYERAYEKLTRAIRNRRSDPPPHELARRLLVYDRPGHTTLVGVDVDA